MYDVSMIDGHIDESNITDEQIIKAYEGLNSNEQLNLFRNLYYNDGYATERGIIANAINEILPQFNHQKAEIDRLKYNLKAVLDERAECKCPDGCPGTLTIYEQIEMGIKK